MKPYNRWDWPSAAPKKPPPEHGIKVKKVGTTWWGQRWIAALEQVLRGDAGRLARGRTYARAGRTHDLDVRAGKVTSKVTGSRTTPYEITIELPELSDAEWERAIIAMAAQARFAAELLAGEMPARIDEVFQSAGSSLFPQRRTDLTTHCTCPDWGDPCKHVAATHYVLGDAFDRDPFLLFELRGRSKARVLAALRAARAGSVAADAAQPETASRSTAEVPSVRLGPLSAAEYDAPRAALPTLHFSFEPPPRHGAVLEQLGAPQAWKSERSPAEALAPLVRAAADAARQLALASATTEADPEREPVTKNGSRSSAAASKRRPARANSRSAPARGRTPKHTASSERAKRR